VAVQLGCAPQGARFPRGQAGDAPDGRALRSLPTSFHLLMDWAHEVNETRQLALDLGFIAAAPPHSNRVDPWRLKTARYRRRNEVERLFIRLKGFRRVFSRFDKLDFVFITFIYFALVIGACACVNRP
jgi:transposase